MRLDIPAWDLAVTASREPDHDRVGRALAAIADELGLGPELPSVSLVGDAQIPPGAGLGSSAAMAVAAARGLLTHAGRTADLRTRDRGRLGERGDPARAGQRRRRRARGLWRDRRVPPQLRAAAASPPAPLRILVTTSGEPRSTAEMVERVAQATGTKADDARLAELGRLTDIGTVALLGGELAQLGEAMDRAHDVLAELGVSTPRLDALCAAARSAGARGAKLTGAGGGGAVIALAPPGGEGAVLAAWRDAGASASPRSSADDRSPRGDRRR